MFKKKGIYVITVIPFIITLLAHPLHLKPPLNLPIHQTCPNLTFIPSQYQQKFLVNTLF